MLHSSVTDINECQLKTDNCDNYAVCNNTPGGYNCACKPGFADVDEDGKKCTGVSISLTELMLILDVIECESNANIPHGTYAFPAQDRIT